MLLKRKYYYEFGWAKYPNLGYSDLLELLRLIKNKLKLWVMLMSI